MNRTPLQLLAASLTLLLAACVTPPPGSGYVGGYDWKLDDPDQARWGDYRPNGVYKLMRPCFIANIPDRTRGPGLAPGAEFSNPGATWLGPVSIDQYREDPSAWPKIQGVVDVDTRIRITELREKGNIRGRNAKRDYPRGTIMEGPFKGTLVDLQQLTEYAEDESGALVLLGPKEKLLHGPLR